MKHLLLFTFILTLLLSNSLFSQDTLYSETFKDGAPENAWYPGFYIDSTGVGNNMGAVAWPGNPSGDGWVGMISTNRADSANVAESYTGAGNYSDFYLEANIFIPIRSGWMGVDFYGLEFRVDSTGLTSGYQFIANFNHFSAPSLRFRKRPFDAPAKPVILKEWFAEEIPGGIPADSGWHKLAVNVVGDQFWFYYDGQELPGCPYTDTTSTPKFTEGFIGVYSWTMGFVGYDTTALYIDDIYLTAPLVKVEQSDEPFLQDFALFQNYPNPFNPSTTIPFRLANAAQVKIEVLNTLGQRVRELVNRYYPAGSHQVVWDGKDSSGKDVPAGIYYYRLKTDQIQQVRKMLLVR